MSNTSSCAGEQALLQIQNVSKIFARKLDIAARITEKFGANSKQKGVQAVKQANFTIKKGEIVGLVGESGCGKSTLGRIVAGVLKPTNGSILYKGKDTSELSTEDARKVVLAVQMIFQDPFASLNPRMRIKEIVSEAPIYHKLVKKSESENFVADLLTRVGLDPSYMNRYPHQLSGGQRQRVGIARALAVNPEFIVCDESIAALDVSVQAQIINLLMDLREQYQLTYLFISHDLSVIEHLCDQVVIMYLGEIVEIGSTKEVFLNPMHPYTSGLLEQIPKIDKFDESFSLIEGEVPSPLSPPNGCYFHTRCQKRMTMCSQIAPKLEEVVPTHSVACHLHSDSDR